MYSSFQPQKQGYSNNNKYPTFPPIMNDGRALTSWQNETQINNLLMSENNMKSSWEYRQYITKNAKKIMERDFTIVVNNVDFQPSNDSTTLYHSVIRFDSLNDRTKPFENSDLKEMYLTKEQLNAKKISPYIEFPPSSEFRS